MAPEIRSIDESDLAHWVDAMRAGFLETTAEGEAAFRGRYVDLDRTLAAVDDRRVVATFRSFASELTVPGGATLAADAITNVTVLPTHRRRRLLTQMMQRDLAAARERGESVAILIASEYGIYGRFGFGPAVESAAYAIDAGSARLRDEVRGDARLLPADEARDVVPRVHEAHRLMRPGMIPRTDLLWDIHLGLEEFPGDDPWRGHVAVHVGDDGSPDGYVRYHTKERWSHGRPDYTLFVDDLVATSDDAYAALWRLCCDADFVATVKADDRPTDELLPWLLTDARAMRQTDRGDFLWVRVLDVPAALSARSYGEGRVVLDVEDPVGLAAGRFAVEAEAGGALCSATDASSDLAVTARGLGAAYLGGVRFTTLVRAGEAVEHGDGAAAAADRMFAALETPWCNTWF